MVFETRIDVRYPDCDQMQIVHHAVYPVWLEMARMDVFEKCGYGYAYAHARGTDPAMVHLELDYGAPVTFPGSVTVTTRITRCEGKKLAFSYEVRADGAEKPNVSAKSFHIWVKDGKSFDIETALPEMFAAYRAACAE
jgi:acyl-CoA thioester hydrolase